MLIRGRCGCGNVTFEANGEPRVQLYCHCQSCRTAHSALVLGAAIFPADAVSYRGDIARVTVTDRPGATKRVTCLRCGTKVINEPNPNLRAILPPLCESFDWFRPQMHVQWSDHVIEMSDSLPKYLDSPSAFGGSGKMAV